jgi:thiamine biosynthesis protein ThiS
VQVLVNGKEVEIVHAKTVGELLQELGYAQGSVAVAKNGEFLPRKDYSSTVLEDKADLEILLPMQGG